MAKKKITEEVVIDETITEAAEIKPVTYESVYTAEELAQNHNRFNTCYAIVKVALQLAGVENATVEHAREIIEKFKNKEIK